MTRYPLPLLRWIMIWLALVAPLRALEIRQVIWGFDGLLVPNRFNPVSILVDNPAPGGFDGQIMLLSADVMGGSSGTQFVQPLFLSPRTSRWVQFHVFVGNQAGNYVLQWGRSAKDRYSILEQIKLGAPATVWLRDSSNPFAPTGGLKTFPDELFPTTVSATEALDSVVLDHVPQWEPARKEAFLDWLKLGGTVHLLPGADGRPPAFPTELDILNRPENEITYGKGQIRRHAIQPREMSESYLNQHGFPVSTLKQVSNPATYNLENELFGRLSSMTRPTVNWTVINLLAIAYIGVIGPLHFYFRRRLDYRVSILVFLVAVGVFGSAFAVVGRRGYGESQTVHSLTVARSLGGGRYDTMQWISAFATIGDIYTLTHHAPANLYSIGDTADGGECRIFNGKEGQIQMDIPLYSSRTFLHRGVMTADDMSVTVEKKDANGSEVSNLRLRTGPGFPKDFAEAHVLANGTLYPLKLNNGALEVELGSTESFAGAFTRDKLSSISQQLRYGIREQENRDPDAHRQLMPLLTARTLGAPDFFQQSVDDHSDHQRKFILYLVARAPASFSLQGPGFDRERGWVLYVQDLVQP